MIHLSTSLKYYKREDVQSALVEHGKDKEVAARFNDSFGKRPDTLTYPGDVLELAKQGATSFHCSEELWANPLQLRPQMQKSELDALRKGWDLILDIDCEFLDYSKIAAELIIRTIKEHGMQSVTAKFSGNRGFHIAVPWEAFPEKVMEKETKELFPEAAKKIALYLKERIKNELGRRILELERNDFKAIAAKANKKISEIIAAAEGVTRQHVELNAEPFLKIDTLLISSRHMYRMPYSMHEKSGLVSIPVDTEDIMAFSKDVAAPERVKVGEYPFMDRTKAARAEARQLLVTAYDFASTNIAKEELAKRLENKRPQYSELEEIEGKIPRQYFPPCIKKILEGVADGRKRALFVLINFLSSCSYGNEEVEAVIKEWNQKNKEPLPHLYIATQLSYSRQKKEKVLPPNCSNASYYKELGIECTPECGNCKNPVAEAKAIYIRAMKIAKADAGARPEGKRQKQKSMAKEDSMWKAPSISD